MSGLEGLAGTPQRIGSPATRQPPPPGSQLAGDNGLGAFGGTSSGGGNLDDLMGMFGNNAPAPSASSALEQDMMNGFAGLDIMGGSSTAGHSGGEAGRKKASEDILDLI